MKYYRSLGAPTTILLQDFATQLVEHSYGNFPCEGGGSYHSHNLIPTARSTEMEKEIQSNQALNSHRGQGGSLLGKSSHKILFVTKREIQSIDSKKCMESVQEGGGRRSMEPLADTGLGLIPPHHQLLLASALTIFLLFKSWL